MKKYFIFLLIIQICWQPVSSQISTQQLKTHLVTLDSFYQLSPLEKAYMQIDKDWYIPGETIWFKGYITVDNQLSELSKMIYVDIINEKDSVIQKTMWKISKSTCKGDILLPRTLTNGIYKLRMYSMWMLNTPEVIDEKIITIISPFAKKKDTKTKVVSQSPYRVNLFPEGGQLVNGLPSTVSFKITNSKGIPVNEAIITLETASENKLLTTNPFHDGMGSFEFTPDITTSYKLSATINGVKYVPDFPKIEPNGISLKVNPINNSRIFYSIHRSTINDIPIPEVIIIAHINGQAFYAEKISLQDETTGGAILKKNLPHGVLTITIFSTSMIPLAERLIFIKKVGSIKPTIAIESQNLVAKGKNSFRIILPSDSANLSVSVKVHDELNDKMTNNNIATYFLMNSEINGYVHQPEYYLEEDDSSHNAALDLLMQTQGWRRITWSSVLTKKLPPLNYFIETGISVRGIITNNQALLNNTNNDTKVNMILKGEDSTTIIAEANIFKNNQFVVNNLDFRKAANLYFQGTKTYQANKDILVKLFPNYFDTLAFSKFKKIIFNTTDTIENSVNDQLLRRYYNDSILSYTTTTLQNVTVTTKIRTPEQRLTDEYVSDWYKQSDFTFAIDSLTGYSSIWQHLQGMVPGLNVSGDIFNPTVNFSRFAGSITDNTLYSESIYESLNTISGEIKSRIAFYVNEMPVSIDQVNNISPRDIALVKVNRTPNMISNATAGSMFIYTRKGNNSVNGKSMGKQQIVGFSVAKEYFSPIYESNESKIVIDKRTNLYWNPSVKIANKQSVIHFYNNDSSKRMKIIVEGLDKNGIPIWGEKIIE